MVFLRFSIALPDIIAQIYFFRLTFLALLFVLWQFLSSKRIITQKGYFCHRTFRRTLNKAPQRKKPPQMRQLFNLINLCKLCKVLNGANHLAGVAVFVVIPRNNLNLIKSVAEVDNHGLSCVKE